MEGKPLRGLQPQTPGSSLVRMEADGVKAIPGQDIRTAKRPARPDKSQAGHLVKGIVS